MAETSRRTFLTVAGGCVVGTGILAAWLRARSEAARASQARAQAAIRAARLGQGPPPLELLSPEQAADLEAIAAQIVPADDLPGAREARVVHFMDHGLATWASDQRGPFLAGLADLNARAAERGDGARFSELPPGRQRALLRDSEDTGFFREIRDATLIGMFAHPSWGGNYGGAGWRVLGFEPRYVWQPPFGDYDAPARPGA